MHLIAIYIHSCNVVREALLCRLDLPSFNKYIMAHYYTLCTSLEKKLKLNGLKYFIFLCIKKISISTRSDCFTNWFLIPSRGSYSLLFLSILMSTALFFVMSRERVLFFSLSSAAEWVGQHNQPHFVHFNYKFRK